MEVQRVWEIYDDRLQVVAVLDALRLDDALGREDVSCAWVVWSGAQGSLFLIGVWFLVSSTGWAQGS